MNMNAWKEVCKNVWSWLVQKPQVKEAKKPQVEKVSKGYSPEKMKRYLNTHYEFRYNVVSEVNEYRPKGENLLAFKLLGKRELNALCVEIQYHNEAFYQVHPEEELFRNHFRTPSEGESCEMLSLSDILKALKEKHGALLRNVSMVKFGNALVASGWSECIPSWATDTSW